MLIPGKKGYALLRMTLISPTWKSAMIFSTVNHTDLQTIAGDQQC